MDEALEDKMELVVECKFLLFKKRIFSILFLDAPQVTIKDGNETVVSGDEIVIECEIDANPAELSIIQW